MTDQQKENIREWLKALRSGNYRQGVAALLQRQNNINYYCCLGVACEINGLPTEKLGSSSLKYRYIFSNGSRLWLTPDSQWFMEKFGFSFIDKRFNLSFLTELNSSLVELNDREKLTFIGIANVIEREFLS